MASIHECKAMLRGVLQSKTPPTLMFWGPPGIGKTSMVEQLAREADIGFKAVISHLYQPVDVLGLPYVVDKKCEYAPPSAFPDVTRDGERGIFFIDELPNAVPAMQSAWGIIVLERATKHYAFPPEWIIACAGNREGDRAGASRLISALENRLIHIECTPSREEFLRYAVAHGIHPTVPAFLDDRADMLIKFDPKSAERAFPSPRSWERASDVMKMGLEPAVESEMLKGAIGMGAAVEFTQFSRVFKDLPRLNDVLDGNVDFATFSARPDIMRAICYSVLAWTSEDLKVHRMAKSAAVALAMPEEWAMLMVQHFWSLAPNLLRDTPSWPEFTRRYIKYLR